MKKILNIKLLIKKAKMILNFKEMHLICSICRPKVNNCPQCREFYGNDKKRHR